VRRGASLGLVGAAIGLLDECLRESRIADSYRAAYSTSPLTVDEEQALDAAAAAAGEAVG
jgi:hypothetical protein